MKLNLTRDLKVAIAHNVAFLGAGAFNITQMMTESGDPQGVVRTFYDYHVGNFCDPVTWAAGARLGPILLNKDWSGGYDKIEKIDRQSVFTLTAFGVGYEFYQASLPRRDFDYTDCGMYLAGALAFASIGKFFKPDRHQALKP